MIGDATDQFLEQVQGICRIKGILVGVGRIQRILGRYLAQAIQRVVFVPVLLVLGYAKTKVVIVFQRRICHNICIDLICWLNFDISEI
ncbi:MAG: hypothetical protein SCM11_18745, partial [Bacillota bacterium]|nr:hypothetical protein [Bacillota bacterium]